MFDEMIIHFLSTSFHYCWWSLWRSNLVGGDWNHGILNDFPIMLGMENHPNWRTNIFFRGVGIPPTSLWCSHDFCFLWPRTQVNPTQLRSRTAAKNWCRMNFNFSDVYKLCIKKLVTANHMVTCYSPIVIYLFSL